jgi:hypothetical protein
MGSCISSRAAQFRENGTEIVRLFARFALGASFLSAVADRFGLWGPYGAKNVSWGNFAHFVHYTGAVTSLFPVHRHCHIRGRLPSQRHYLGYCLSQASKYECLPPSPVFSFCYSRSAWSQVSAPRHPSTIPSSRQPLQYFYWRCGSLTDSRWTSF